MLMLSGAIGDAWQGEFLSYEAPTYFGMLCAAFEPVLSEGEGGRTAGAL